MQDLLTPSFVNSNVKPSTDNTHSIQVEMIAPENPSRRALLKAGLFGMGGLVLGFGLPPAQKAYAQSPQAKTNSQKNKETYPIKAWLQLSENGKVTLVIPVSEMGQGSQSALAMIFADELGADYHAIEVKAPLNSSIYNNPAFNLQLTGGSTAVRAWWQPLSTVAATLRELLVQAAAQQWQIKPDECTVIDNRVIHRNQTDSFTFQELIEPAKNLSIPKQPKLKSPSEYRYIGKPMPRLDTRGKTNGTTIFGMDVQLPEMLIATVAQSPVFGGEVDQYNEKAALSVAGVQAVVKIPNGIAVVADSYWQAKKGLDKLQPTFKGGETQGLDTQKIEQRLHNGLNKTGEVLKTSQPVTKFAKEVKSTYAAPYLAHTTMEPMNATAHVTDTKCEVWAPTQNQAQSAQVAADISLLQPDQVTIHTTYLGGGFGRRAFVDYVAQAVTISAELHKPVKVIWSREEDIQHDFYRPAAVSGFEIKTDTEGYPLEWRSKVVTDSPMAEFTNGSDTMIDNAMSEGLADQDYVLPNLSLSVVREDMKIPIGFWRSVGHSYSGFFMEGIMNELALKAQKDPFDYRRKLLKSNARSLGVLNQLETLSNWHTQPRDGIGRGVAVVHSFGSYAGQVVEARIENNRIVVDKVYCVIDCGKVVNPETVKRQISSAVAYGLTAALKGKIHFENGRVLEKNFDSYPMLNMKEMPEVIVEIVDSHHAPGGYGEPGVPPLAPALTAAITQLTGKIYRDLPIKL